MRKRKTGKVTGIIFCVLFFVIFATGAVITFPKGTPAYLNDLSIREIKRAAGDKRFYCIEPGDYRVIDQFEEKKMRVNQGKGWGKNITHAYYTVQIRDKNDDAVVIAVRTDKKQKDLKRDDNTQLMGLVAKLPAELQDKMEDSYTGNNPLEEIVLNDTPELNSLPIAAALSVFALLSLGMLILIIVRSR